MARVAGSVGGLHHREKLEGITAASTIFPRIECLRLEISNNEKRSGGIFHLGIWFLMELKNHISSAIRSC